MRRNTPDSATFDLASLGARMHCMILPGIVSAAEYKAGKIKVTALNGTDAAVTTDWIPWITPRAGHSRYWDAPSIGENCLLFCPSGRLNNAYAEVGSFSDSNILPCGDPDIIKKIHYHPEVGLFEYRKSMGYYRNRVHAGGQFRQEVGIYERSGNKGTSSIIQGKDFIQLRVGLTQIVIRDGSLDFSISANVGGGVERKTSIVMDKNGVLANVEGLGFVKLRKDEISAAVLQNKEQAFEMDPDCVSMIINKETFGVISRKNGVLSVGKDEASIETREQKAIVSVKDGKVINSSGSSQVVTAPAYIENRIVGSAVILSPASIMLASDRVISSPIVQSDITVVPGGIYAKGPYKPFGCPLEFPSLYEYPPIEISKELKPYKPTN